jgi:hypothetical protein
MSNKENKYFIIGNYPLIYHQRIDAEDKKWNDMDVKIWRYQLPSWFYDSNDRKIIKITGSNVIQHRYTRDTTTNPIPETEEDQQGEFFQTLHTTIHSNIIKFSNAGTNINTIDIPKFYNANGDQIHEDYSDNLNIYDDYMMLANNFFTPKFYELPDNTVRTIDIWFRGNDGKRLPIFKIERKVVDSKDIINISQLIFNIEGELVLMSRNF